MSNKPRVLWLLTDRIPLARIDRWRMLDEMGRQVLFAIGNPDYQHTAFSTPQLFPRVRKQLEGQYFTSIFDLTGAFKTELEQAFPNTPVEDRFSLSRVRKIPTFETAYYESSMQVDEIAQVEKDFDLRRPLIFDDVGFTGGTNVKTMELWGIRPEDATHAFLVSNSGHFGDSPGSTTLLANMGGRVVMGTAIHTPVEDVWHFEDLYNHPNLMEAFYLAVDFSVIRRTKENIYSILETLVSIRHYEPGKEATREVAEEIIPRSQQEPMDRELFEFMLRERMLPRVW